MELVADTSDFTDGDTEVIVAKCTASGAKPQPDIVWKDDKGKEYQAVVTNKYEIDLSTLAKLNPRPSEDNRLTTVVSELKVSQISRSDHHERQFTCTVKQNGEVVVEKTTSDKVNVLWAPTDVKMTNEDSYTENDAATVTCGGLINSQLPQKTYI